jgi:teichuronic acid exporter
VSLRQKTISGLTWSFIDSFASQGMQFMIGIILARLLSPKEFGLIGIIIIFTAISQSFVDSGFSKALIRKNDCGQEHYSTAFYFNCAVGGLVYFALFLLAQPISSFFGEPQLVLLVRVLGISLIINSVGLVQKTILTKNIDFKLQTKISIIATLISGIIGVGMAFCGWGVWSLVWKTLSSNVVSVSLFWFWSTWRPARLFNMHAFREMFDFGSKLLASGLIDTIYRNIYYLVIGKYFSAVDLGYFTRADEFRNIPSADVTTVIERVSYPVLSNIENDPKRLKAVYKKLITCTMLISFVLMVGMAAVAKPMVITLIGEKWLPCVPYLQPLCFVGMLYPLHALNLNMLTLRGRSDLFLRLEVIKKILAIPTIIIGVFFGIKVMIVGMFINSVIAYFLNSCWSGRMVDYPMREQLADITPSFILAIIMGICVLVIGYILPLKPIMVLSIQIVSGALITLCIARAVRLEAFMEIREMVLERFAKTKTTQW